MPRDSPSVPGRLQNAIGSRGEDLFRVAITDFSRFPEPLFKVTFLGSDWETTDHLVELLTLGDYRPYFLAQVKATRQPAALRTNHLTVSVTPRDIRRLLAIPGPTYLFGVFEPAKRVFVKAVYEGMPSRGLGHISLSSELTPANLQCLHDEVRAFWGGMVHKPSASAFP